MRNLILILLINLLAVSIKAQEAEIIIAGTIIDGTEEAPLIGATVKCGQYIATTDYNGRFKLFLPSKVDSLMISYVGFRSEVVMIKDFSKDSIDIQVKLFPSTQLLDVATVTGTRYDKSLAESIVTIEVIKPSFIERNNSVAIDDLLDRIPGVSVIGGQANIRGGSGFSYGAGSRVLFLVDDIPALAGDAGTAQFEDYAIENVAQVEVLKGASSALYGSAALNGIVNLKTKYPTSTPETHIRAFYRSYLDPDDPEKIWYTTQPYETSLSFSHKQKYGKLDLVLGGNYVYRDSYNEDTYTRYARINPVLRYRATDRLIIGLNANLNRGLGKSFLWWQGDDVDVYRSNESTVRNSDRTRYMVDPYASWYDPAGGRHKLMGRLYHVDNQVTSNQSNTSDLWYGEYQYQRKLFKERSTLTTGISANWVDSQAELFGDNSYTSNNLGLYVQLDHALSERLDISVGARWERNTISNPIIYSIDTIPAMSTSDDRPVLRLGLNWQADQATYLRASWGQGYRFPTIAEKFVSANIGFPIVPNPDLMPETGWSAELGLKQGFALGMFSGYADVALFWTEYQDMMEFVFVLDQFVGFQSQNVGDTRIRGLELTMAGNAEWSNSRLEFLFGYMYIDPKFQNFTQKIADASSSDENILKYRFKHSFKADAQYQLGKWYVGFNLLYNSYMEAIDLFFSEFIPGLRDYRTANNNGNLVINLRTGYQINEVVKITLLADNVFNEEYSLRPAILEPPRNIALRADVRF